MMMKRDNSAESLFARHLDLSALNGRRRGRVRCIFHDDHDPSLSVDLDKGLFYCFGCGVKGGIKRFAELVRERSRNAVEEGVGAVIPSSSVATVQPPVGCTLKQYAKAKRLPLEFLERLGLSDIYYFGRQAVRIPYFVAGGGKGPVRIRLALNGDNCFCWKKKKGSKLCPYGLWLLDQAKAKGSIALVEGESDSQTLWLHDLPALGIPGAGTWLEEWAEHLEGIPIIYIVVEPDQGGQTVLTWLARSSIRDRVRLVNLGKVKDVSDLYLADRARFRDRWQAAIKAAVPWAEHAKALAQQKTRQAWKRCKDLAASPRILDRFQEAISEHGLIGEERAARLLYLILTSRLLDRPVSAAVKGPSSAGKSFIVDAVLRFFPPTASYTLSAMSERALAYSEEPLVHRFLVLYEAAGVKGEFANYLVRSLLSEGRLRYETVEKTRNGLRPRLIEKEGPTGLLVTTTAIKLHEENETRLLSIPTTDTPEQTKEVLRGKARDMQDGGRPSIDLTAWHALQEWLARVNRRVEIPFAEGLAELIPPVGVRLRRDFGALLILIATHALLHQKNRTRTRTGEIVAVRNDYAAVRELVKDLIAEGVEATIPQTVRETVEAVKHLTPRLAEVGATVTAVAHALKLDKGAAWRRVRAAIERGYLKNLEDRKGRPARLAVGEPMPKEIELLPPANDPRLRRGCTVAVASGGISSPSPKTPTRKKRRPTRRRQRSRRNRHGEVQA